MFAMALNLQLSESRHRVDGWTGNWCSVNLENVHVDSFMQTYNDSIEFEKSLFGSTADSIGVEKVY